MMGVVSNQPLAWRIALCMAVIFVAATIVRYILKVVRSIKRLRIAEERIQSKIAEIRTMPISEAEAWSKKLIREKARLHPWSGEMPQDVDRMLLKLHPSVQSVLRGYQLLSFPDTGTEISANLLCEMPPLSGYYQIGMDKSIHHKLLAKSGGPEITELNEEDAIVETYPSLFHFFLLAEGDLSPRNLA